MIRNLKVLVLAVGAVLAFTAMMASAASAASYTASAYPATIRGSHPAWDAVLTTEGGKVECATDWEGTLSAGSSTLTLRPNFWGCSAFGYLEATMNAEGCTYLFHATSTFSSTIDVVCPAGQSIKITAGSCKVEIKGQTGLKSVGTTNSGSSVIAKPNVTGIAYTVTQDGFLCPFSGTGNKTGATYVGEFTLSRVFGGSISVS
jgi:hypothetical protein